MHQQRYQVRFEWGEEGARRITPGASVVVVADELDGHGTAAAADLAAAVAAVCPEGALVLHATESSAADAAAHALATQERRGDRAMVAIVAAGSLDEAGYRTAVEDLLAAGAVVDALAAVGIDFSSPEAAAACAAWQGLRRATAHLLTASTSGLEAADPRGQRAGHSERAAILRSPAP